MKKFVLFFAYFGATLAIPLSGSLSDYFYVRRNGSYDAVSPLDMVYNFYSLANPSNPVQVLSTNVADVKKSHFTPTKETVIIIHGYWETGTTKMPTTVREAIVNGKHDVNIIVIDWSKVWKNNDSKYVISSAGVVGGYMADFIKELVKSFSLDLSKTILVGHSFGGLYIGKTGGALGGQVKALVALDPYPGATKSDGKFLQVIHTTSLSQAVQGHVEFFPCGGHDQSICHTDHGKAFLYYAESINSNKFIGRQCENFEELRGGKCSKNPSSYFGTLTVDTKSSGKFFLDVNNNPPFAKG